MMFPRSSVQQKRWNAQANNLELKGSEDGSEMIFWSGACIYKSSLHLAWHTITAVSRVGPLCALIAG
jgi:hypothetical protein